MIRRASAASVPPANLLQIRSRRNDPMRPPNAPRPLSTSTSRVRPAPLRRHSVRAASTEPAPGHERAAEEQHGITQERRLQAEGRQGAAQHRAYGRADQRATVEHPKGTGAMLHRNDRPAQAIGQRENAAIKEPDNHTEQPKLQKTSSCANSSLYTRSVISSPSVPPMPPAASCMSMSRRTP